MTILLIVLAFLIGLAIGFANQNSQVDIWDVSLANHDLRELCNEQRRNAVLDLAHERLYWGAKINRIEAEIARE